MTDAMRTTITQLCDELISADAACFARWCQLLDRPGRPDPAAVVVSQQQLHRAASGLRHVCLPNAQVARAVRQDLMRAQIEGEIRHEAEIARARTATERDAIRRRWVTERLRIFQSREAITIGLGWPHRGEPVTVTTSCCRGGKDLEITGPAVYLQSNDVYNVTHLMWAPELSASRDASTLLVAWQPRQHHGQQGNADPAGGIGLRVSGAETRPLPVPLPRWPTRQDIEGGPDPVASTPVGAQLALSAAPGIAP